MARPPGNPEQLFDRPWQPGHPFRPRLSSLRRWGMLLLLSLLLAIIFGYWILTDSGRVKALAESTLSRIVGGPVVVGDANLSIFQGLRLENVTVYTKPSKSADSMLFSAKTLWVRYDPRVMIRGKLEVTQILAIEPRPPLLPSAPRPPPDNVVNPPKRRERR